MDSSGEQIRLRLEEDRNGLVNYIALLQKQEADLRQRRIMATGVLQYLSQLLGDKDANH